MGSKTDTGINNRSPKFGERSRSGHNDFGLPYNVINLLLFGGISDEDVNFLMMARVKGTIKHETE